MYTQAEQEVALSSPAAKLLRLVLDRELDGAIESANGSAPVEVSPVLKLLETYFSASEMKQIEANRSIPKHSEANRSKPKQIGAGETQNGARGSGMEQNRGLIAPNRGNSVPASSCASTAWQYGGTNGNRNC